ncbi:MAG: GGDEF domain-containing protein [Cyanobacteria bacterium REEB65]|nr:GGDEF domain-containing protein [Cyanobacteria bacterium REEB65]
MTMLKLLEPVSWCQTSPSQAPDVGDPARESFVLRLESLSYLVAQELSNHLRAHLPSGPDATSVDGFSFLAEFLQEGSSTGACDGLARTAMVLSGSEGAWLAVPEGDGWRITGRAWHPNPHASPDPANLGLHLIPLLCGDEQVGALALWPEPTSLGDRGLEGAFERALGAALGVRAAFDRCVRESLADPLTGLPNREGLERAFRRMTALADRNGRPLSVLMLDLDHFKAFNDRFGHLAGDDVLASFGGLLGRTLRASDLASRWGGEEFVVLVPNNLADAHIVGEKIRAATERLALPIPDSAAAPHPTVSIGITERQTGETLAAVLARADRALYQAKAQGRNRVAGL